MKADAQTEAEVMAALNKAMEAYAGRDMEGLLACIAPDPDVVQFGMSAVNAKLVESINYNLDRAISILYIIH